MSAKHKAGRRSPRSHQPDRQRPAPSASADAARGNLAGTALAAAYAEAGRFDDACRTAEQAIDLARAAGREDHVRLLERRLQLYRQRGPYGLPTVKLE